MFFNPKKCHLKSRLRGTRKEGNKGNTEQWSHDLVQGMVYGHTAWGMFVLKPHCQTFSCLHTSLFLHMISCNMSVLQAGACSQNAHRALLLCLLWLWGPLQGLLAGQWGTLQQHLGVHGNAFRIQWQHSISMCLSPLRAWSCRHGEEKLSLWGNRFVSVPSAGAGYGGVGVQTGLTWVHRVKSHSQSYSPTFRVLSTMKPSFWPQEFSQQWQWMMNLISHLPLAPTCSSAWISLNPSQAHVTLKGDHQARWDSSCSKNSLSRKMWIFQKEGHQISGYQI